MGLISRLVDSEDVYVREMETYNAENAGDKGKSPTKCDEDNMTPTGVRKATYRYFL
jgi:hypothetical protein